MSVTGGVKFFQRNFALLKDGSTATASSNDEGVQYILSPVKWAKWFSVGSSDATEETITITLSGSKTIDRIFILGINLKEFDVKYFDGLSFVDFANVVGVNGVESASISETNFVLDSAYYEFDEVTTSQIQIKARTTQVANEEKEITTFITSKEIGTLLGYPKVASSVSNNEKTSKALSQREVVQKTYERVKFKLTFKTHPFQEDLDTMETLFESIDSYLIWPCGGRTGSDYFKIEQKAWRLDDIYNVQNKGRMKSDFTKNIYTAGFDKSVTFVENI